MLVIALGGNALIKRGESAEAEVQRHNVQSAVGAIAEVLKDQAAVITHGNGPQVGLLALQAESYPLVSPYPLDILNAETEGMLGYLIELELQNLLPRRKVVSLLTQVLVDREDDAFDNPSKPIGPFYDAAQARLLAQEHHWTMAPDGERYRRVVPSPEPKRIVELPAIKVLLDAGALVICVGGGGIPVAAQPGVGLVGVEAVIDKDLSSALLAIELDADRLMLLTDVDAVYEDWGSSASRPLHQVCVSQLRGMHFVSGSMAPKVEAVCRFVEQTGGHASIGRQDDAMAVFEGRAGTQVRMG